MTSSNQGGECDQVSDCNRCGPGFGRPARNVRRLSVVAALAVAIGLVFTMGIKIGAQTAAASPVKSIIAAYLQ